SMSEPMPTTAWSKSRAPSWSRTSAEVVSASTTWVSTSDIRCTGLALVSTPRTSKPSWVSSSATALPKRPRPTTRTCEPAGDLRPRGRVGWSANDRALLGMAVQAIVLAEYERREQGDRADAPDQHQCDDHQLRGHRQQRREVGAEPDGAERGD